MDQDYVIITAGGKGTRMGSDIPKQFLPIDGQPVLMRTIQRFWDYSEKLNIILVLPENQVNYWACLCKEYQFNIPCKIVLGGRTRFHSIYNGLASIPDQARGIVGVHDGVRPFPSIHVISRCYQTARTAGAVIPVMPVEETLRYLPESKNVLRSDFRLVQTPQCFDICLLKKAYQQPYSKSFTDDASVVEAYGKKVTLIEGNRENIKLTTPFDMNIAEVFVKKESAGERPIKTSL